MTSHRNNFRVNQQTNPAKHVMLRHDTNHSCFANGVQAPDISKLQVCTGVFHREEEEAYCATSCFPGWGTAARFVNSYIALEGYSMDASDRTDVCASASFRRASRAICHLYDLVLTPNQLKVTQFTMLRTIAEAGEVAHCDLARQAIGSEETFSRRLAAARRSGWVSMRLGDRQRRLYRLTEKGEQVLHQARPYWQRAQDRLRSELGDADWQAMLSLVTRVADAAIRAETAPRRNTLTPAITVPELRSSGNEVTDPYSSLESCSASKRL